MTKINAEMVPLRPVNVFCFPAPASTPRIPCLGPRKAAAFPDDQATATTYIRERVMADKGLSMTPVQLAKGAQGQSRHRVSMDRAREERQAGEGRQTRRGAAQDGRPQRRAFADPHGCQAHNQPHRGATASGALQVSRASQRSSSLMLTRLASSGRWYRGHTRTRRKAREPS